LQRLHQKKNAAILKNIKNRWFRTLRIDHFCIGGPILKKQAVSFDAKRYGSAFTAAGFMAGHFAVKNTFRKSLQIIIRAA
jgi:hypothetical protein